MKMVRKIRDSKEHSKKPIVLDEQLEYYFRNLATSGNKLSRNNLILTLKKRDFIFAVTKLRKKWGISGIAKGSDVDSFLKNLTKAQLNELIVEIEYLCDEFTLHPPSHWRLVLEKVLCDEIISKSELAKLQLVLFKDNGKNRYSIPLDNWDHWYFPLALHISPFASQNSIIQYIKAIYKTTIEPLQKHYKKYRPKMSEKVRTRAKQTQRIHQYIYENRHLKHSDIAKMVRKEFGKVFDYSYISKVILREKHRRN